MKVRADHDAVRDHLEALEAEPLGSVTQTDTYYDAPHRDFAETDEALRVRHEDPATGPAHAALTYKGPLVEADSKTRSEAETEVGDEAAVREILVGVGFEPAATVEKERERYRLADCVVTLDAVTGLGEFVEVEFVEAVAEAGLEDARGEVFAAVEALGLDPARQVRTSYLGLLLGEASP